MEEFSFRSREQALERFRNEEFDLLIIGGGITGAGTARDAASRGLKVALVEKRDFAWGTSSRSSKLIHGGLRYLENFEFSLVFEALAERSLLLKSSPHLVRPLPFYLPVYANDPHTAGILSLGMWLYDFLALFRAPGFHKRLSKTRLMKDIPFLKSEGLKGGFRYFDASMWDDALAVETLRAAHHLGAAVANYVGAISPLWKDESIVGFRVRNFDPGHEDDADIEIRAKKVVVCAGPWTDQMGEKLSIDWSPWLKPSKGIHLVFDAKRIPIPGALVMSHPSDGRISFVIPRPDVGAGVVIVGTTDGPTDKNPEKATIEKPDVEYLMALLHNYFPSLELKTDDILSAYVGVRPLMGSMGTLQGSEGQHAISEAEKEPPSKPKSNGKSGGGANTLQKVSREHHIGDGPGGTVIVAGGKYTTHRTMAEEIVDYTLKSWKKEALRGKRSPISANIGKSSTRVPVNPKVTADAKKEAQDEAAKRGWELPEILLDRYGAEALELFEIDSISGKFSGTQKKEDPEGFPLLEAQFRFAIRSTMVMNLSDFYFRRLPLFMSREDHGIPWAKRLASIWAEERGFSADEAGREFERLKKEIELALSWKNAFGSPIGSRSEESPSLSS